MSALIQFRIGEDDYAQHCRISNSWFEDCKPADPERRYMWTRLYGRGHRLDHNHFLNRAPGDDNGF